MRILIIIMFFCVITGCSTANEYPEDFEFIFSYGVMNKNILNTFEGTYTKDLVIDGGITTELKVTKDEKQKIYTYMKDIGLFQYAEKIEGMNIEPASGYSFEIQYNGKRKWIEWIGEFTNNKRDLEFKELTKMIQEIIKSKEEYKALPSPNGYYE